MGWEFIFTLQMSMLTWWISSLHTPETYFKVVENFDLVMKHLYTSQNTLTATFSRTRSRARPLLGWRRRWRGILWARVVVFFNALPFWCTAARASLLRCTTPRPRLAAWLGRSCRSRFATRSWITSWTGSASDTDWIGFKLIFKIPLYNF